MTEDLGDISSFIPDIGNLYLFFLAVSDKNFINFIHLFKEQEFDIISFLYCFLCPSSFIDFSFFSSKFIIN